MLLELGAEGGEAEVRPKLYVFVPTNRAYTSERNWGKPAPMDGLNEIVDSNRTNKHKGARVEKENLLHVARFVRSEMWRVGYEPMTKSDRCKCQVAVKVVEPHDHRDVPNVLGGVLKYTCDALTARNPNGTGAIWDDNSHWMELVPRIEVNPACPGIEITVTPLEDSNEAQGTS